MLYLLYGKDTYRSRKKLGEIIEEFRKKSGSDLNFHRIDAQEDDFRSVLKHISGAPSLFAEKKLVVVEYALSAPHARDALFSSLARVKDSENDVVILWDTEPADASQKEQFAAIKPLCKKIQEFKGLKGAELVRWIHDEARGRGVILSPAEASGFASLALDSWGIMNALEQYAVGGRQQPTVNRQQETVFHLGDTFFSSPRRALPILFSLLNEGYDEFKLFSYLVNHARTLALIQSYDRVKKPIPERHGIHPYVIKKASALARALPDGHFSLAIARMFEEDVRIKTGIASAKDSLSRFLLMTV